MSRIHNNTILPGNAQECLRKLAIAEGIFGFATEAIRCKTGNLSISYEVTLKGNDKEMCLFTKCIPEDTTHSPLLPLQEFFLNEVYVYRYLSRLFHELQAKAEVPEHERFSFPKFYETSSPSCLVLENLASKGYAVTERRRSLTLPVATMAVERLAQYHALNIAVAKRHPGFFRDEIVGRKHLVDFVGIHKQGGEEELYQVIKLLKSNVWKGKVERFARDFMSKMMRFYGSDLSLGVLCHGDFRGQNLMTLELNGELLDVLPIDYQLVHYGHPLNDLMYFIFLATDHNLRRLHLQHLKTRYYVTLKRFLLYFDLNIEDIYPVRMFEKEFEERAVLGFIQGLRLLPLMLASTDDVPEIFGAAPELNVARNNVLAEWINGLVEEFVQWGYL